MRYVVDHDFHIHSQLSSCSRHPEQTAERILKYAKDNGFKQIVLTDHYWDNSIPCGNKWYVPQDLEHISRSKPLPQADGIEFLFGCEGEVDVNYTLSIPRKNFDEFGFMVIPTTHMQTPGFNIPVEDAKTPEGIAKAWVDRINAVLDMDLPFHKIGLAHPVCSLIAHNGEEEYLAALKALTNADIARTFAKAAKVGIGIELNSYDFRRKEHITLPYVRRIFDIAKDCGCKFYLASDAHTPKDLEIAKGIFEYAVDLLGLTEDDKFHICG